MKGIMALMSVATNVRYWIAAAIIIGLIVGDVGGANDPTYLIASLMLMMCFSLTGLHFKKEDFVKYRKKIAIAIFLSSFVSTGITLAIGLLYSPDLWGGWVLLACVPAAISTISATLIMRGDVKLVTLSMTAIYFLAIVLTPLFSYILIGDAIDPLNFVEYVILFIVVPLAVSYPLGKLNIPRNVNSVIINICFFFMVLVSFGRSRDMLFSEPWLAVAIALGCVARITIAHIVTDLLMKKAGVPKKDRVPYCLLLVWRNSGLAMTLALLLMPDNPGATLPSAISMIFEVIYFVFMIWYYDRTPQDGSDSNPDNA
jgi:BASS family bile acid:Na+ symporter